MATTQNVVIDPVTRIEGHLRVQAIATDNGSGGWTIGSEALVGSTMVRGVEKILQGRDPRDAWAFTQRICGVCTVVHGLTSVRAVENAIGVKVPRNADYIRNMMIGAQYVHDHVMHFYHLHALDWVDVTSALNATSVDTLNLALKNNPNYKPNGQAPTVGYFDSIKNALKSGLIDRGQLGLFSNGYWGHAAYKLKPEENLLLLSHYLEALPWAREVVKLHTIFGGKDPHPSLVVGGMPCSISTNQGAISESAGGTSLNAAGLAVVQSVVTKMKDFVDQVYLPDVVFLASKYPEWRNFGATAGDFLSFGEFPDPNSGQDSGFTVGAIDFPGKYVFPQATANLSAAGVVTYGAFDPSLVTENVAHAWYAYPAGSANLKPSDVATNQVNLKYDGPAPDSASYTLDQTKKYSWIKSPRYNNKPMEVGPLAHILIMYGRAATAGVQDTDKLVKYYVDRLWVSSTTGLGFDLKQINSTLGRIFARALETKIIADQIGGRAANNAAGTPAYAGWYQSFYNNKSAAYFNPAAFTKLASPSTLPNVVGFGFTEAPRGALGHWVKIDRTTGMISQYQCIVASQWNAGPRDSANVPGPYETALKGHVLKDPAKPLEVLRTIHSFDPCIGCAVHILDAEGNPLVEVDIHHSTRC